MAWRVVDDFRVGSTIVHGVSVYLRSAPRVVWLIVVPFLVPVVLTLIGISEWGDGVGRYAVQVLWLCGYIWMATSVTYLVLADLRGNKAEVIPTLFEGWDSVTIVSLFYIATIAVTVGSYYVAGLVFGNPIQALVAAICCLLFLVPFCLFVPIAMAEHFGLVGSFVRSRDLTRGYRWKMFALLFVLIAVSGGLKVAVGLVDPNWLIDVVSTVVWGGVVASILAVVHHDLRCVKEGAVDETSSQLAYYSDWADDESD